MQCEQTLPWELDEMFRRSADDRSRPNSLIKRYESTVIPDGQRQQVSISDLLRPKQLGMLENRSIGETDIVGPEAMMFCCLRDREALEHCSYW
jgi:hypothetical protein